MSPPVKGTPAITKLHNNVHAENVSRKALFQSQQSGVDVPVVSSDGNTGQHWTIRPDHVVLTAPRKGRS